jgi:DNA-binding response OmpR family regulator
MSRILILDDDASVRLFFEEELRDEGYDVFSENDGTDLSRLVMEKRPDLVVLDLKPVAVSGFELLKELRTKDCRIPVLLCTGYDLSLREARAMGADDVFIKSSDLTELKLKIKKALKTSPSGSFTGTRGMERPVASSSPPPSCELRRFPEDTDSFVWIRD